MSIRHPAKYTDSFISIFADLLKDRNNVLDPFAGTGKLGLIKQCGFSGTIYANEIEPEWINENLYDCDLITCQDAELLDYPPEYFDAIRTSPTYGNRMADHHKAKDGTKRNTYTHCLGRQLSGGNTGKMQWGVEYMEKHKRIYKHLYLLVKPNGLFICNIKNHIRNGKEINVKEFHENALISCGFIKTNEIFVETKGNGFGANSDKRTNGEYILVFQKGGAENGRT
jgi:hypothetical protein